VARRVFAAVDIGASGGRVMAGTVEGGRIEMTAVHQFPNAAVEAEGHLRWDVTGLHAEVLTGLDRVAAAESVGIDTWGVDYGLLDSAGRLLAEPISYRDDRTAPVIDEVHSLVPPDELYHLTGLQHLPFTTIYQLAAERRSPLWSRAARAVLIPDLLVYQLTGELRTEITNASTTGLLDVRTRLWSAPLLDGLGIPADLFPELQATGERRGCTPRGTPVVSVASHDTASAVVGVPATTDRFAYIACGTWSLVGLETPGPILSEGARAANFTNEAGVDGRNRFLRNVGGLWLLQECQREWCRPDLEALLAEADRLPAGGPTFDVADPSFIPPGNMPSRVQAAAGPGPLGQGQIVRAILDSLASAYARTIRQAEELTASTVDVVHIVGGGSLNQLLCRLTAEATGLPVIAGPVEATAMGNIAVQARTARALPADLGSLRACIASSIPLRRYHPS
jgi:rhamnulokinase